mmetsp:Transcript_23408/g.47439  ORF Transcript_23408/g.47439 Transcript_23408/m.47439 type:complete len:155 (-) Transcript_23408:118-582(-)|eukprot:CAMPEP_0113821064 /NCGR_PEP_ID=MMETSP0328-20130328/1551_1 /TAXON_ID=39455 /ORGANISM="Alexandrium minutum" /LENGTH=154 /DNA_ID=CAMNT_0000788995 /DNA_START=87 /DNA_END=551 /DNA_ORIENTATION=+ /assembly_acc=CAM_ASM_000350
MAHSEAALKIFLRELRYISKDHSGQLVITPSHFHLKRVWIQGYVICRDGDDVVDIDDGSDVMSFDVADLLQQNPEVDDALQAGRYVSCVSTLEMLSEDTPDLRMESVCALDGDGDALAEPFWWLEVAEAHSIWSLLQRPASASAEVSGSVQCLD